MAGVVSWEPGSGRVSECAELGAWWFEIRRRELTDHLSIPFVHEWTLVYAEGVVAEGQIADADEAKRYAELAFEGLREHVEATAPVE